MSRSFTVLGINYGGHDTSAALMLDGELVAACEQERYTLDKHSRRFPVEAIHGCLDRGGIAIEEVDEIAFAFQPLYHIQELYLRSAIENPKRIGALIKDIGRIKENYYAEELIRDKTGFIGQINYYNHHLCHLASTWYPSGFDNALVVSYDGIGEVETGLLAVGRAGSLDVFHNASRFPDSLGLLYSAITHHLGWRHHCDEGIVMGLACYGNPMAKVPGDYRNYYEIFEEIVEETGDYDYCINRDWIAYHQVRDKWVSDQFCDVFGERRENDGPLAQHHKDLAAALQMRLENLVLSQLRRARQQHDLDRLCLSGGVALNCSMNGKIEKSGVFEEIFVQPASGDAGVSAGACYLAHKERSPALQPKKMHNFYLGSRFSDQKIEEALVERGLSIDRPANLFAHTATRLAEGKIIGWFQGGAEFGPRALGNRSILTRPFPADMKDYLNSRVKFREEFRPFAPAVLFEHTNIYFEIKQESPHMLIACQATDRARKDIPATVHVDGSCRVQSVKVENNDRFFKLLSAFFAQTGCPVLLNTSFNIKGQPIVDTPLQAVDCYLSTNIDCLVVGDCFVEKHQ
jgi:carbamoyltransferase